MQTMTLADQVKEARAAARLTQVEVAVRSGVSITVVRNIEQGITKDPRYSTVQSILAAIEAHAPDADSDADGRGEIRQNHQAPDLDPSGSSRVDGIKAGAR